MIKYIIFIHFFIASLFFSDALAQESVASPGVGEDFQIVERARKRLYPGGQDEEDLQVQAHLVKPKAKKGDEFSEEEAPTQVEEEF